jgi:hypothetical protein
VRHRRREPLSLGVRRRARALGGTGVRHRILPGAWPPSGPADVAGATVLLRPYRPGPSRPFRLPRRARQLPIASTVRVARRRPDPDTVGSLRSADRGSSASIGCPRQGGHVSTSSPWPHRRPRNPWRGGALDGVQQLITSLGTMGVLLRLWRRLLHHRRHAHHAAAAAGAYRAVRRRQGPDVGITPGRSTRPGSSRHAPGAGAQTRTGPTPIWCPAPAPGWRRARPPPRPLGAGRGPSSPRGDPRSSRRSPPHEVRLDQGCEGLLHGDGGGSQLRRTLAERPSAACVLDHSILLWRRRTLPRQLPVVRFQPARH